MSVTLDQLWTTTAEQLQPVLQTHNYGLSGSLGYDRALVAMIYYNEGMLSDPQSAWVAHPDFLTVMKVAPSLAVGLHILKAPFMAKLLHLHGVMTVVTTTVVNVTHQGPMTTNLRAAVGGAVTTAVYDAVKIANGMGNGVVAASWHAAGDTMHQATAVTWREHASRRTPRSLEWTIAYAAWKRIIGLDATIGTAIAAEPFEDHVFDPLAVSQALLRADLTAMVPNGRCFYLWSLWEILGTMPPVPTRDTLFAELQALTDTCGCGAAFAAIPVDATQGLSPLVGQMGIVGGKTALIELINQYAARPPTRAEVMQRLLTL